MVVAPFKAEAIAIAMSPAFQTPCHLTQRGLVALTHSVDTEEARVRVPFAASHMEMEEVPRRKEPTSQQLHPNSCGMHQQVGRARC